MKILFICKYNRFRSRIAEAYFNKINKNKDIETSSGGVIRGFLPLDELEVRVAKEFGLNIKGKPKNISMEQLKKSDKIIIVADDVPAILFDYALYKNKVETWKINDNTSNDKEKVKAIIKSIIEKVDKLNLQLNNIKTNI